MCNNFEPLWLHFLISASCRSTPSAEVLTPGVFVTKFQPHFGTPIEVNVPATALQNHPDRQFVHVLINGFTHGFHPGIEVLSDTSHVCRNLQSTLTEPHTVDTSLAKEEAKPFLSNLSTKDRVVPEGACKIEMHLWQHFLSSLNGISFF